MKAVIFDKKSLPLKMRLSDVEAPVPGADEVLIKVKSVSLNAADYRSFAMGAIPKSNIFGSAIAGTIEQVGPGVHEFSAGDEVVGDLSDFGFGGLAEYAVAPTKALVTKPAAISFDEAVTLPVAATTALKALVNKGNIQASDRVLVVGSSGGVGAFALQLAKHFGAHVTAVCSTRNVEQSQQLGADAVIDYTQQSFTQTTERYDLVIAVNGNYGLLGYRRILRPKGTYVMVGGSYAQIFKSLLFGWALSFGGKTMKTLAAKSDPNDLTFVANLLSDGRIKALIHKTYSLDAAPEAMDDLSKGHAPSKLVIQIP